MSISDQDQEQETGNDLPTEQIPEVVLLETPAEGNNSPQKDDNENLAPETSHSIEESQSSSEEIAPKLVICGVCKEVESKYKCSQCKLPYCSMGCYKLHTATHPPLVPTLPVEKPASPPQPNTSIPRPGTVAAAGYKGPFAALDTSKELQELFTRYPRLQSQLEAINTATLPPVDGQNFGHGRKGGKGEPWNSDRGLQKGVVALSKARNTSGEDGKSIREFSRLVLQILSGEEGAQAAEVIQKEIAEENTRIIEQLLNHER